MMDDRSRTEEGFPATGGNGWEKPECWARQHFGGVALGDRRRSERLLQVAERLARGCRGTLPSSFGNDRAGLKGAYRLLANAAVTHSGVIAPHLQGVRTECEKPGQYLMIEDNTLFDFSPHRAAIGLGRIGNDDGQGFCAHTTLAARVEDWSPAQDPALSVVGLLDQQVWVRDSEPKKHRETHRQRLERPRESRYWARACLGQSPRPCGCQWIYVADRESDIYEVMQGCTHGGIDFVIRAAQLRALADGGASIFQAIARAAVLGCFEQKLRARPGVRARTAMLELRAMRLAVRGPWRPEGRQPPLAVNVVEAREIGAPHDVEPLHWVLLTSLPCTTFAAALRVVKVYAQRWLVEEYHKALKTGTRIEDSQLSTAARLEALLGVLAVIAVRLLDLKLRARAPQQHALAANAVPRAVLAILKARYGDPPEGWTPRGLLVCIARLGGFLARKSDGDPGWLTLWRGHQRLDDMLQGYSLAQQEGEECG